MELSCQLVCNFKSTLPMFIAVRRHGERMRASLTRSDGSRQITAHLTFHSQGETLSLSKRKPSWHYFYLGLFFPSARKLMPAVILEYLSNCLLFQRSTQLYWPKVCRPRNHDCTVPTMWEHIYRVNRRNSKSDGRCFMETKSRNTKTQVHPTQTTIAPQSNGVNRMLETYLENSLGIN